MDRLNDIGEVAGRTGFTTDLVQGFQELGREATAEIENVNKALQAFSEQAATADSFLDKLFKANDRKIDLSDPQKNLQTFMDLVRNAGSAAEQLRIVTGVVGDRAGRELTEAFAKGGDAVVTAFAKMEGAGRAHSAVQIEEAGKIKAKFVEVSADIQGNFEGFLPQMRYVALFPAWGRRRRSPVSSSRTAASARFAYSKNAVLASFRPKLAWRYPRHAKI